LRHLDFLNSKNVQDSLNRNDFQLDDIRINPKTIYLVLPANKITSYNRLARLWISSIKSSLERINDGYRESRPVLFMLDEVAQLGRMEPLVNAISLSRSYGIKLWLIFQDVAQMKVAYPNEEWRTFFSNTKAQQFFGISSTDTDTCKFVSEIAGQTTITFNTESYSEGTNSGGSSNYGYSSGGESSSSSSGGGTSSGQSKTYSINQQVQARPLVNPNEVAQITIDHILIFGVTKFPIMAKKMPYYNSKLYIKRYPFLLDPATYKI
jgi:type IV secretion system protein VirD4